MAGIFYPATASELAAAVEGLVSSCPDEPGTARAILSPHGSLEYSGRLEAAAWKSASARMVKTIVLIAPAHQSYARGIFLPESTTFAVPTASFRVDLGLAKALRHHTTGIAVDDIPHLEEHAIEVQLIMAAGFFPEATILPLIVSDCEEARLDALLAGLGKVLERNREDVLIALSSNLAVEQSEEDCDKASSDFLDSLVRRDLSGQPSSSHDRRSFCGMSIVAAFLRSNLSAGLSPKVLGRSNSSCFGEEGDPVVGYGAVGFFR